MKIINAASKISKTLIGTQEVNSDKAYRPLYYLSFFEADGAHVVCNRLTRSIVEIDEKEKAVLKNGVSSSKGVEELIENWFLVPTDHDDYQFCLDTRELLKVFGYDADKARRYLVMTTSDCNARCFYCYQMGRYKKRTFMSDDTACAVVEYVKRTYDGKPVRMQWHGGEPLYNSRAIDIIASGLKNAGIEFFSAMITNGYLLNEEMVKKAVELWNLKRIQIPIDGTEEVYNRVKAYIYRDDPSPYKTLMNNIKCALDNGIHVSFRLNMDKHNKEDLYALVDEIHERFSSYEDFSIHCDVLYDDAGAKKPERNAQDRLDLVDEMIKIEKYCESKGMVLPNQYRYVMPCVRCMADSGSGIVISPEGNVGRCDHMLEGEETGTIFSDEEDLSKMDEWKEKLNSREVCEKCPLFPDCIRLKKCADDGDSVCDDAYKKKQTHREMARVKAAYFKNKANK